LQDHDAIFNLAMVTVLRGHEAGVVETSRYDEVDDVGFEARGVDGAQDGSPLPLSLFV
jgi:hypothetical protein